MPSVLVAKSRGDQARVFQQLSWKESKVAALGPTTADSWILQDMIVKANLASYRNMQHIHKLNINNIDSSAILNYPFHFCFPLASIIAR